MRMILLGLSLLACLPGLSHAQDQARLARQAKVILEKHCYRCHGENGTVEGGVNYLLDHGQLISRKKVVPNSLAGSKLWRRILTEEMPPESETQRPSAEEIAVLKEWILAGAPDFNPPPEQRAFIAPAAVLGAIRADLQQHPGHVQRFLRYFTITHLYNSGLSEDELSTYRQGISKLVNSLSWGKRIVVPTPIDAEKTILRIDLRDYKWSPGTWEMLESFYPFGVLTRSELEQAGQKATGTTLPHLRGDWFVASAALPPLYHELLQLPGSEPALEKLLKVNAQENVQEGLALRAGFNSSGVSRNNRLIERHDSLYGAYWKSYDFAGNTGRQNLFASPLGPGPHSHWFDHDGGEIIFSLPNGLQAYMLVDGHGRRIDKGPTAIVSDPRRPDRAVVNGLSCMSCHARGIIVKDDQVRPHVEKNRQAFLKEELKSILTLYPPAEKMRQAMDEDAERFRAAVEKTGCQLGQTEPIVALALRFEMELDLPRAAAELGMTVAELRQSFAKSVTLGRILGPLAVEGGTVQREVFTHAFPDLVRSLERGTVQPTRNQPRFFWSRSLLDEPTPWLERNPWASPSVEPPLIRPPLAGQPFLRPDPPASVKPDPVIEPPVRTPLAHRPGSEPPSIRFEDPWYCQVNRHGSGHLHAVAFSPLNASRVALETRLGVAAIYDHSSQRITADMTGHRGSLLALDFSPDGRLLASGGIDQTARLWNAETGEERALLVGHTGFVQAVQFAPHGRWLATGSERIRLWDVATGEEKLAFPRTAEWITSLAVAPDSRTIASAARTVQLWDVATGKLLEEIPEHDSVLAVAYAPDGATLALATEQGAIILWDVKAKRERRVLKGHKLPVCGLAFTPNGRLLLSVSGGKYVSATQEGEFKAWDPDTGAELAQQTGHNGPISSVAVAADGRQAVTAGLDGALRFRDLMFLRRLPLAPFEGHALNITSAAVTPDSRRVVTASADRTVRLWDLRSGEEKQRLEGHTHQVARVIVSPDGQWAYSASLDRTIRKWDLAAGKETESWHFPAGLRDLAASADGKTLAAASSDQVFLIDAATGKQQATLTIPSVQTLAFSPDGRRLAVAGSTGPMQVWDLEQRKEIGRLGAASTRFLAAAFSPDGRALLTGDADNVLRTWDVATGAEVQRFKGLKERLRAVAFYDHGKKVMASCAPLPSSLEDNAEQLDHAVGCWDARTGEELKRWDLRPETALGFTIFDEQRRAVFILDRNLSVVSLP